MVAAVLASRVGADTRLGLAGNLHSYRFAQKQDKKVFKSTLLEVQLPGKYPL